MDYRELLIKYIAHVAECEGITFIGHTSDVEFTDEEKAELVNLEGESNRVNKD